MTKATSLRKAPQTIASLSYARLRQDIMCARLAPGSKLKIGALAEFYETGPGPMREALNRLSSEGLVTQEDQKGFRVAPVSMEELRELTMTRCWVHGVALRDAIEHGDSAWEERIVVAAHRLSRSPMHLDGGEIQNPEWDALHREFHCAIISAARSRWIRDFYALLFDAAHRYQRLSVSAVVAKRDVNSEHQAILGAVLARRADDAIALSDKHITRTTVIVEQTASLVSEMAGTAST
jgi:GntR family transcriptional regulator, carbon starvation induced regulator